MRKLKALLPLVALLLLTPVSAGEKDATGHFLDEAFPEAQPEPHVVWLKGDLKKTVSRILGHKYPALRIRYWRDRQRSAWVLEEIGKEQPITFGVIINDGSLQRIRVLTYRESRGGEIRYPFFTDQFNGIRIDSQQQLDRHINSISGATLSVRAMKKIAALALYLDSVTVEQNVQTAP